MKCPIRYNVWVDEANNPVLLDQDCLNQECAWWDEAEAQCAVLSLATWQPIIAGKLSEGKHDIRT